MVTKYVIYHSAEWMLLVETGWITHTVVDHPVIDGWRVAIMVWPS